MKYLLLILIAAASTSSSKLPESRQKGLSHPKGTSVSTQVQTHPYQRYMPKEIL